MKQKVENTMLQNLNKRKEKLIDINNTILKIRYQIGKNNCYANSILAFFQHFSHLVQDMHFK